MMPSIFVSAIVIFSMCIPLTIVAESYAQMFMIINKFFNSIIKNKLRTSFDIVKSE